MASRGGDGELNERTPLQRATRPSPANHLCQFVWVALIVGVVAVAGAANRVTFKLMQWANINYLYFACILTTITSLVLNTLMLLFEKFVWRKKQKLVHAPHKCLFLMGFLDSLQGVLVVVGGGAVSGMSQNVIVQAVIPITMLISLVWLRPRGCKRCRAVLNILSQHGAALKWKNITSPTPDCSENCVCRVLVGESEISVNDVLKVDPFAGGLKSVLTPALKEEKLVTVYSSVHSWTYHIRTFYHVVQYVGVVAVVCGVLVCIWPSLTDSSSRTQFWFLLFSLATIPAALSALYKEVVFGDLQVDAVHTNFFVTLYQTLCTVSLFPVAACVSGINVLHVISHVVHGALCFVLSRNSIRSNCSVMGDCAVEQTCCDSCNGHFHNISQLHSFEAVGIHVCANIVYNIAVAILIRQGSARMMYVSSTLVLPLAAVGFSQSILLGEHSESFTTNNIAGLCVVVCGLVMYRFAPMKAEAKIMPVGAANTLEHFIHRHSVRLHEVDNNVNRSTDTIRSVLYSRLGIHVRARPSINSSPFNSPLSNAPPVPPVVYESNNNNNNNNNNRASGLRGGKENAKNFASSSSVLLQSDDASRAQRLWESGEF